MSCTFATSSASSWEPGTTDTPAFPYSPMATVGKVSGSFTATSTISASVVPSFMTVTCSLGFSKVSGPSGVTVTILSSGMSLLEVSVALFVGSSFLSSSATGIGTVSARF